nr:hypothetical protein [Tanacetum cinerariifolium]
RRKSRLRRPQPLPAQVAHGAARPVSRLQRYHDAAAQQWRRGTAANPANAGAA